MQFPSRYCGHLKIHTLVLHHSSSYLIQPFVHVANGEIHEMWKIALLEVQLLNLIQFRTRLLYILFLSIQKLYHNIIIEKDICCCFKFVFLTEEYLINKDII